MCVCWGEEKLPIVSSLSCVISVTEAVSAIMLALTKSRHSGADSPSLRAIVFSERLNSVNNGQRFTALCMQFPSNLEDRLTICIQWHVSADCSLRY